VAALTRRSAAHKKFTTVAPFRAWRGLRVSIAQGPARATITYYLS